MASATGTAVINFGSAAGGSNYATVTITGQTAISAGSHVEAFFMAETYSPFYNAYEQSILPLAVKLSCGNVVAGTGFDIIAASEVRFNGSMKVRWVWAD